MQGLIQKIMVTGAKQAELDYRGALDAWCEKPCSLPRGFKIRYFEIESGGTFCKIHTILNIKQGGASAPP